MPNITRIKNNQITDATITFAKIASGTLTGALFNPALTLNSNVTILGNLSVTGNTSTINSTNTLVNDPLIVFNNGYAGSPTYDIGIIANRNLQNLAGYGSVNTAFVWKEADAAFVAIATTETGITTGSINNSGWANVRVGNLTALTTTTGGLQAVAIGNVTPGTAAFTTGTFSSTLGVTGATTLTTATIGGLQAVAIGNVTPGTGVFTTGTFNTATTGGLQAVAIGNVTPGTGAFTTLSATGALTLNTVTAASYQGIVGNVTPAAGTFTSLTAQTETVGGLQAVAIGNVTPGTGAFTTGTFSSTLGVTGATTLTTATTGGLQAVAIGNVTPGTAAFTTATAGSFQGIIGNAVATTAFFTTANATTLQAATIGNVGTTFTGASSTLTGTAIATTVNAATIGNASAVLTGAFGNITTINATDVNAVTIGNVGASVVGNGGFLSNIIGANVAGTVTTANASIYAGVTNSAFNSSFYVAFTNASGGSSFTGNTQLLNSTLLNFNPSTGTLAASAFSGGSGSFTTVTAGSYQGIIGNATATTAFFTTANATTVNADTIGNIGAKHVGDGGFLSNITATYVVGTIATANVALYENIATSTTNAVYYAYLADKASGNVAAVVATGVNVNPSTSTVSALGFVGGTGAFTTLSASGATTVTAATESTSSGTGALVVTGGAGIGANLYVGGNTTIIGNLTVVGTTTAVQSTTLDVSDLNITVAKGASTAAAANGAGLTVDGAGATLTYLNATDTWNFNKGLVGTTITTGGLQAVAIGNVTPGTAAFTTATAGGLQAQAIGNVTPGTGVFTTGTFNTATTGGLQAVAIGNVTPGTGIFVSVQSNAIGNVTPGTGAFTTASTTGNLTIGGNIAVTGNIVPSANVTYSLGTSGNRFKDIYLSGQTQYIGGSVIGEDESGNLSLTTATGNRLTISSVSNVLVATGNVTAPYHLGNAYGTTGTFLGSGTSTSATTGAVVVTGGVGVGGNIYVGTNAVVTGTLSVTGATTLTTGNIGGLQAVAIGNVTPGTAVFTTGTFNTATTGGLQAVAIGNVTAGTGAFTTLSASTWANITGTTAATSTTTGALVVAGGAGIAGALHVGSTATITGNTAVNNTLYGRGVYDNSVQVVSTSTGAGNLSISAGGINLTPVGPGAVTTGSSTLIPVITTDAYGRITTISTAAVEAVAGAANVAFHAQTVALTTNQTFFPTFSNVNGGNSIPGTSSLLSYNPGTGILTASAAAINGGTASSSYTSGALIVTGGVGISGAVNTNSGITAAGKVITTNNEEATSTSTGAIQATGGISTQANLFVGNAATFNSSQTAGMDFVVRGKNDATLIWARPSASYDTVIIGNSAVAGNVIAGAKLNINTTDSIKLPVGTNAQRPGNQGQTDVQGMFRYNTTQNAVEWYTGTQWIAATTTFTVITDEQYAGDGSTVEFTMGAAATTASTIVSINGVMQIPTLAYSCSGVTLTFTEAPASSDVIDVRRLTTTETVVALNDATGYNAVDVDNTNGVTISTGTATKNARYRINTDGAQVSLLANTAVASANTATTIDTMSTTVYRSAKYTVQATNGASYQVLEALLISNGTTATVMAYGTIQTAGNLGIISATQSGSDALLQFVALNASTNVRITKEYLLI